MTQSLNDSLPHTPSSLLGAPECPDPHPSTTRGNPGTPSAPSPCRQTAHRRAPVAIATGEATHSAGQAIYGPTSSEIRRPLSHRPSCAGRPTRERKSPDNEDIAVQRQVRTVAPPPESRRLAPHRLGECCQTL